MHIHLLSTKVLLQEVEKLNPSELEEFVGQILHLKAQLTAPSVSKKEGELLLAINKGFPQELNKRFEILSNKRRDGKLSDEEYSELMGLSDQVEKHDLHVIKLLSELAEIRQIPLRDLMKQLGMNSNADA